MYKRLRILRQCGSLPNDTVKRRESLYSHSNSILGRCGELAKPRAIWEMARGQEHQQLERQ